jgi:hypothetical protein
MVRDYLSDLYLVDDEFALTGDARSGSLVSNVVNVMLYQLIQRVSTGDIPEYRAFNKDQSIKWFKGVAIGQPKLNGVAKTEPDDGRPIRWGDSNTQDIQLNY